jgi:integrase
MSHLKGFFTFLFIRERIHKNIGAQLEMPRKTAQKVIDIFSDAELALIYAADPLACLLCETGIRKSEARNLQRRHIDLGHGNLVVYNGKGAKDRVVPLTTLAAQMVANLDLATTYGSALVSGLRGEDHLWPTKPGGGGRVRRRDPISNTAMQRWWADDRDGVLARAGVVYRNMHVTRHTFATRLIQRGARIENVQLLLGHSSIQTTVNLYAHLDVEDARADLSLLELRV